MTRHPRQHSKRQPGTLLDDHKRAAMREALRLGDGNVTEAAFILGVAASTVYAMAGKLGIDLHRERWLLDADPLERRQQPGSLDDPE